MIITLGSVEIAIAMMRGLLISAMPVMVIDRAE